MKRIYLALSFIFWGPVLAGGVLGLPPVAWQEEWQPVQVCRHGMQNILSYVRQGNFKAKDLLSTEQRQGLKETWRSFFDYVNALDELGNHFQAMAQLSDPKVQTKQVNGLVYGTFLTQYRCSLEFLAELDKVPGADTLLNEAIPESGLPEGSFAAFKLRFLNVVQAGRFASLKASDLWQNPGFGSDWEDQVREDEKKLLAMGASKGTGMTVMNGQKMYFSGLFNAWFPAQKHVSEWMGATKVWRLDSHLISEPQAKKAIQVLRPGDILFSRHEWYMSNLGLPGFWSHAALFIGTDQARNFYFDDPEVKAWVKEQGVDGGLDDLLRAKYPKIYSDCLAETTESPDPVVLEAVSAGVIFSTMEKFASADSLSAVRPRLSKLEKARAIFRAFGYAGRPYDFNFDFQSDETLVCSELVYKAYEPAEGFKGMKFPLQVMAGHVVSSPNGMVQQFDAQYATPDQQSDLVLFLDGHEKEGKAVEAGLKAYRTSWKRPKWNVLLQ